MQKEAKDIARSGYIAGYTYKQEEAVNAAYLSGYMDKEASNMSALKAILMGVGAVGTGVLGMAAGSNAGYHLLDDGSLGGGIGGAIVGSGVGTSVGTVAGGYGGAKLADYIEGANKKKKPVNAAYSPSPMDKEAKGGLLEQSGKWIGDALVGGYDTATKGLAGIVDDTGKYIDRQVDEWGQIVDAGIKGGKDSMTYKTLTDITDAGQAIVAPLADKVMVDNAVANGVDAINNTAQRLANRPRPQSLVDQIKAYYENASGQASDYYKNILSKPENWGTGTKAAVYGGGGVLAGLGGYGLYKALAADEEEKRKAPRRKPAVA